jgi:hypothetical protein
MIKEEDKKEINSCWISAAFSTSSNDSYIIQGWRHMI